MGRWTVGRSGQSECAALVRRALPPPRCPRPLKTPPTPGKKALAIAQAGDYDVAAVKARVDAAIADNAVMVFRREGGRGGGRRASAAPGALCSAPPLHGRTRPPSPPAHSRPPSPRAARPNHPPPPPCSWSGCPFCKKAKAILDDTGAKYTALELDTMGAEGKAMRAELAKLTGRTSMPNVWIGGVGVGGCNDGPGVATLAKQGELLPKLKAVGAV